jgi:hypothetical protein
MGILLLSAALGFGFIFLSRYLHMPWLVLAGTSLLLAIALPTYIIGLQGIDRFAETHREELFTELSKTTWLPVSLNSQLETGNSQLEA